jgi:hypothetical protein
MKAVRFIATAAVLTLAAFVPLVASAFQPGGCPGMGC